MLSILLESEANASCCQFHLGQAIPEPSVVLHHLSPWIFGGFRVTGLNGEDSTWVHLCQQVSLVLIAVSFLEAQVSSSTKYHYA